MRFILYTDGATRPVNPGPSGYGAALYGEMERPSAPLYFVGSTCGYLGEGISNNQAEYAGLIAGLQLVSQQDWPADGPEALVVRCDSLLLINQVSGSWQLRSAKLGPLHAAATEILADLRSLYPVSFEHVKGHSGEKGNEEADRLAGEAVLTKSPGNPQVLRYLGQSEAKKEITLKGHDKLAEVVRTRAAGPVLDTGVSFTPAQRAVMYQKDTVTSNLLLHFPSLVIMEPSPTLVVLATGFKIIDANPAVRMVDKYAFEVGQLLARAGTYVVVVHQPHAHDRWMTGAELGWETSDPVFAPIGQLQAVETFDSPGWPPTVKVGLKHGCEWQVL